MQAALLTAVALKCYAAVFLYLLTLKKFNEVIQ
jgi:hypothetical protein